jgi:cytochrome c
MKLARFPVLALVLALLPAACNGETERTARALTGGEPQRGRTALRAYGCGSCHRIPGVAGAEADVATPLDRLANREFLAGRLPNSAENLITWVRHPQSVVAGNAMPELNVSDGDARDMAAYLYTLK